MDQTYLLACLVSLIAGLALAYGFYKLSAKKHQARLKEESDRSLETARLQAENERNQLILEAKESALAVKASADEEIAEARKTQTQRERKLDRREEQLQHQEDSLVKQQRGLETSQTRLATQNQKLADLRSRLEKTLQQQVEILERASGMSKDEASQQLMKALESELESERGAVLLHHKRRLSEVVKEQGREMLLTAIQRYSSTHTAETTTSTIDVPTDDIKGRIIGREGRNIRAFEKATGVDVIIDDTPGVVIVSGFDPVRREVARLSLSTLISDGRIHPAKIEEVVAETNKKIESVILQYVDGDK